MTDQGKVKRTTADKPPREPGTRGYNLRSTVTYWTLSLIILFVSFTLGNISHRIWVQHHLHHPKQVLAPPLSFHRELKPDDIQRTKFQPHDDLFLTEPKAWPRKDDAFWLEDEPDDFQTREYQPRHLLPHLRDVSHVKFFHSICGHYRFHHDHFPQVSVIVTFQNERDGLLAMSVESLLGRTRPSLLKEIIIIDDNTEEKGTFSSSELEEIRKASDKIHILVNSEREGCARSRIKGAGVATGEVLVFIDSHVEMLSSTWLEHLLLPILENPRTIAVQAIDLINDLDLTYEEGPRVECYGVITDKLTFGYQMKRFPGKLNLDPAIPEVFESPFGPGSLFAIRRDEFFRLGGYDKGLHIWGLENIELALKSWMCGGRLVFVPCSRAGHVYRINVDSTGHWPPSIPAHLRDRLGFNHPGPFLIEGSPSHEFSRLLARNSIRVLEMWLRDHPAKAAFYRNQFGSETLPPEWQQFVDEMRTDPAALEQEILRKRNQCRDFDWFDRHVYMRILGVHHPWHPNATKTWE